MLSILGREGRKSLPFIASCSDCPHSADRKKVCSVHQKVQHFSSVLRMCLQNFPFLGASVPRKQMDHGVGGGFATAWQLGNLLVNTLIELENVMLAFFSCTGKNPSSKAISIIGQLHTRPCTGNDLSPATRRGLGRIHLPVTLCNHFWPQILQPNEMFQTPHGHHNATQTSQRND